MVTRIYNTYNMAQNTDTYQICCRIVNKKERTKWRCDLLMGFINDCYESECHPWTQKFKW